MLRPINPASLRASPIDSAPVPETASDPAGFASLLRQQTQPSAAAPAPAPMSAPVQSAPPAPHAATNAATPSADAARPASATTEASAAAPAPEHAETDAPSEVAQAPSHARSVPRPKLRGNADAAPPRATGTEPHEAAESTAGATPPGGAQTTATAPSSPHAAVADWLAALQARPAPTTPATPAPSGDAADDTETTMRATRGAVALHDAADAADAVASTAPHLTGATDRADTAPVFAAALAERREAPSAVRAEDPATAPVGTAGLASAPAIAHEAAPPVAVALPTPVDAPDFAQALGVQLSVLAKDGVQRAELHLNPAEMGPVSVQIVMDGTQARIDFGADVAATRHAIEAGLPELASALRDAGYTLAGGGVSQHAGGRQPNGGSASSGGDSRRAQPVSEESVTRVGLAARHSVARGGVDLYA